MVVPIFRLKQEINAKNNQPLNIQDNTVQFVCEPLLTVIAQVLIEKSKHHFPPFDYSILPGYVNNMFGAPFSQELT